MRRHESTQVAHGRQLLVGGVAVALALVAFTGCGTSDNATGVVADGSSVPLSTDAGSSGTTTETLLIPDEAPGKEGSLVVGELPLGWKFEREVGPSTQAIKFYQGAPVDVKIPSGGQAYQSIAVNATYVEGLRHSGQAEDLRSLATSVIDYGDAKDARVLSRPALTLVRPAEPSPDRVILFTIGDWRIQIRGLAVDAETLMSVAEEVDVR